MSFAGQITKQYLVAFNNGPLDDPANITTVASPAGTLGAHNQWTDITPWVKSHQISRGRQHELRQFEAGTCQLELGNTDGRFYSWNTSGPYYGLLQPRLLMQVRVTVGNTTWTRFTGHIDAWPVQWPDAISGWAELHASDALRLFNLNNLTSTGYRDLVVADGASQYWRLSEQSGAAAASQIPGGATGTYLGAYTLGETGAMPADPATSVNLMPSAPTASGWVLLTPAAASSVVGGNTSHFSIDAWVNVTLADISGIASILMVNDVDPATGNIRSTATFYVQSDGSMTLQVSDAAGNQTWGHTPYGGTGVVPNGTWTHLAATFNAGTIALYVNGVAQSFFYNNIGTPGAFTPTFAAIGSNGQYNGPNFAGSIQDVAIYPTALTAAQVAKHYSLGNMGAQSTDQRIGRVLDLIGWSSTARNLDTNTSGTAQGFGGSVPAGGVQAVTSPLTDTSSLSHMQSVEASEGGALFMTIDGKVRFVSRQNLFSQSAYITSQATLGDNPGAGDLPIDPNPTLGIDDIDLYNEAVAARPGGATQRTVDTTSVSAYGRTTWQSPASLLNNSDQEVLGLTQYAVARYKTPVVRVQQVTVNVLSLIGSVLIATLFGLDLLQAVTVERDGIPGTPFSQLCNIEQVVEKSDPDTYTITFATAVANPPFWILGVSRLGIDTTLAY